jgi:5'-3' exoribonuclease 2
MGIPTFFRKIISEYPDTHFSWRELKEVDYFYLDFNSIIYGCIYAVDKKTKPKDFDKELMKKVNEYLQKVICDIVKPQKGVYLAFDGPVPRAKMIQQRYRRF